MTLINTLVFDLGGVLIDWNPVYVYKTIFGNEQQMNWFFQNICTSEWNEEQDAGRTLKEATDLLIAKFPEHEVNIRIYYDRWEDMLAGPIHETVEILRQLKFNTTHRLYALTNWSAETFPVALQKYEFLHWFDGIVVSGEEKTRKPFQQIYRTLIERFQINPSSTVYTDDSLRNIAPAKELGFHTIHFQSPPQLKLELKNLGVI
jgi:2-haloacid dehalogenase